MSESIANFENIIQSVSPNVKIDFENLPKAEILFNSLYENISDIDSERFSGDKQKKRLRNFSRFLENNKESLDQYFDKDLLPKINFYYDYSDKYFNAYEPILPPISQKILETFPEDEQNFWNKISTIGDRGHQQTIIHNRSKFNEYFNQDGILTSQFFSDFYNSRFSVDNYGETDYGVTVYESTKIPPEVLSTFSKKDQVFWTLCLKKPSWTDFRTTAIKIKNKINIDELIDDNSILTSLFFENFKSFDQESFNKFFYNLAKKNDWQTVFGKENIDKLLSVLPDKTDEKRNAFTHNEYDRTSQFFEFLITNNEINFELNSENIKLVTDYIESFGLAKSSIIFEYFQNIKKFENGIIENLPSEYIQNGIKNIEDLKKQVNEFKKKCFSQEPIINPQELSQFQQGLLSIVTGHAVNCWNHIPLDQIIRDFSVDMSNEKIVLLDSHFKSTSSEISKIKTEVKEDLSKNSVFKNLKQEIIAAINDSDKINDHKSKIADILTSKISILSSKESNDFIKKQIDAFTSHIELINQSNSIDSLIKNMLTLNLNLGTDKNRDYQEEFNSVLRQLVFQKTFIKHQSPEWRENLKNSLINGNDISTVNDSLNFLNNIIKDHTLNFSANNEEKYWNQETFETMKKYSKVFKNNLSIGSYIKELQEIEKGFKTTKENSSLKIEMIPDRGLIGEMSGYMADVCYVKVYPLLKQYPDLIPYKFIDQSNPDNPEFIGSVLVFKVDSTEDEPVFLIRAFDVPNEQKIDIGNFFEKFVNSLSKTAQELGVKKIIAAGTTGTISNYSSTTNYVLSNYVIGKTSIPLKEKFDFNGYDITKECYLIRDLK